MSEKNKCIQCLDSLGLKFHQFKNGTVCQTCYLTAIEKDIERWGL